VISMFELPMTNETSTTAALSNNLMDDQFLMVHLNSCDGIEEFSAWCLMLVSRFG
jgi:hypothetical protein